MSNQVVVIRHLDGSLAYTGLLHLAAQRLCMTDVKLKSCLQKYKKFNVHPYMYAQHTWGPYVAMLKENDQTFFKLKSA